MTADLRSLLGRRPLHRAPAHARAAFVGLCAAIACLQLLASAPAGAQPSEHPFEIVPGSFHFAPSRSQAGAHADWVTSFDIAHEEAGPATGRTYNDVRTTIVNLPAGFIGNNTAVPTCTPLQLHTAGPLGQATRCPPASQVGTISVALHLNENSPTPEQSTFALYNMEVTSPGIAAMLGFKAVILTQELAIAARPADEGLTVTSPDIVDLGEAHDISVTVWAVPGAHEHDAQRGQECTYFGQGSGVSRLECRGGGEQVAGSLKPFLANPTSCEPTTASMSSNSWEEPFLEEPGRWPAATTEVAPTGECDRVPFSATIGSSPSTTSAESPTGLDFSMEVPQTWDKPETLATSDLKDASVTLPQGMTINPSAGSGLGSCSPAQFAAETAASLPGAGCPESSKIGSVEIETPLLAEKLEGAVFVATPFENPFGSLLALYVVAKAPERGVIVKVAGQVHLDPVTGQLTTTFLNNPQAPFGRFTLKFRPGATAPLVTPPVCGSFSSQASLAPWSAPLEPQLVSSPAFAVTSGVGGGPCPSGGVPPFHPQVIAGTNNNAGGSYSPFYLRLIREDGEQELTRFSTVMPSGLTGNLSGIPFCPDAAIQAARERTGPHGGGEEEATPSCPAASQVGHTIVGAGVGTVLAQTPGRLYLAGPYQGAPLSLVSITSAKVGPFDLGTVVIRFALRINPITAQVEVDATGSDAIPHIIQGIVVHVRDIRAYVDRPGFIKNPTSCERLQIQNLVQGANGGQASLASPFQAADCQSLRFQPDFKAQVTGRTSKTQGAGLKVDIAYPPPSLGAQANIHAVKVELPIQLPSRLTTLQQACLASVFEANPASCPPGSIVGHAKAITPILPVPITGPAYFVSYGNAKFPELVIVLQGYGITIDLHGETFISKKGITSSTFHQVPDQPVTSFELDLPQASNSALAANVNLCALTRTTTTRMTVTRRIHGRSRRVKVTVRHTTPAGLTMPTEMTAQNGMVIRQATPIAITGCPRAKPRKVRKATRPRIRRSVHR
jgi:hypothetical protein